MRKVLLTGLAVAGTALTWVLAQTTTPAAPQAPGAPTYYQDVRPILEANCAGCHTPGGAAPFSLRDAQSAQSRARMIAAATASGHMPPWMPAGGTPPLQHERKLTQAQKDTLRAWAAAGAPIGDASRPAPVPAANIPSIRTDLTVSMPQPYTPKAEGHDDYRCFLLDPNLKEDRFITGYNVVPGIASQVHHVLLFQVPPSAQPDAAAKNGKDGRDGWTCFGGPGVGGTGGLEGAIGSWTPGTVPSVTPEGTGVVLKGGNLIVMQVHYNLMGSVKPDTTRVQLQLAPSGAKLDPLRLTAYAAPVELPCPAGISGDACDRREALRQVVRREGQFPLVLNQSLLAMCNRTPEDYARQDAKLVTSACDRRVSRDGMAVGAILHMHTRGTSAKLTLNPGTPGEKVLLDIPVWDFHWQGGYVYQQPIPLKAGDVVRITCTWDNTRGTPHRYVVWGEGTDDEMCLGALSVR